MSEKTCGNIDGKPCEWSGTGFGCPVDAGGNYPACGPMLVLCEARARVRELEAEVSQLRALLTTFSRECQDDAVPLIVAAEHLLENIP